ncbi:MAG: MFS transporter [Chloracidobacterium sp.]|uniref:MFS transporter n=1 Tax=Chloracidobacterium validum TaxID=2821543 RepID=A0ABX8B6W0_9BACT|nr:MFS transporter [Chloracidobacterium validum]QUW02404.1 MFS transporter [Chloracidobacterium validum]
MPSFPPTSPPIAKPTLTQFSPEAESSPAADASAPENIPTWLPTALHAFAFRDYRRQWAGAFASSIGSWMQQVAQAWLILELTSSPFYLGLDAFLAMAPMLGLSLVGGAIADRVDRRKLLLASQAVQLTSALTLTLLVGTQALPGMRLVYAILGLSLLTGMAQAMSGPAYMALLPNLVPKSFVGQAVAGNAIQFNLARVIGPMLAGLVMAYSGATACFALNALSFLAVMAALATIQPPQQISSGPSLSWRQEILTGLRYVFGDPARRQLCLLAALTTGLGIAVPTLLPQYTKITWQGDEVLFSRLAACSGLGAVGGAMLVATLAKQTHSLLFIAAAQVALGLCMALLALTGWFWLACLWLFLGGALLVAAYALVTTCFQQMITDDMRGRAVSLYMVCFRGGMAIGGLLAGALAHWWNVPGTFGLAGFGLTAVGLWAALEQRLAPPSDVNLQT